MASLLARGFALGLAIAASPGPVFFLCLRRSLLRGWAVGLASGLGVATADGLYAAVAVFGVAAIAGAMSGAIRWLEIAGGLALLVLGIRAIAERPREAEPAARRAGAGLAWSYASTLAITIANPATIISFAALAAALGAGLNGGLARPGAVVAGVALGSATWWLILAGASALVRTRLTPAVTRAIGVVSGAAIAALGALAVAAALGH